MGLSEAGIVSIWNFQEEEANSKGKDKKMVASLPISKGDLRFNCIDRFSGTKRRRRNHIC